MIAWRIEQEPNECAEDYLCLMTITGHELMLLTITTRVEEGRFNMRSRVRSLGRTTVFKF